MEQVNLFSGGKAKPTDPHIMKCVISGNWEHSSRMQPVATSIKGHDLSTLEVGYVCPYRSNHLEAWLDKLCVGSWRCDEIGNTFENIYTNNVEKFFEEGWIEDLGTGLIYHPKLYKPSSSRSKRKFITYQNALYTPTSQIVDFMGNVVRLSDKDYRERGVISQTHIVTEGNKGSFGVEIETVKGVVPPYIAKQCNFTVVRDGSLKDENGEEWGGEYVTGVLRGDNGFRHLRNICMELSKRCLTDRRCGIHVHLSINYSKEYVLAMYLLCKHLENEIFNMMPASRRHSEYSRKLDGPSIPNYDPKNPVSDYKVRLGEDFTKFHNYVSGGYYPDSQSNRRRDHPKGHKCNYDHSSQRYCWVNFVPALFDTRRDGKTYTIEFRNHSATLSYLKIKNWVKICMAINWFAENYAQEILVQRRLPSLSQVILLAYPKNGQKLINYIHDRTTKFNVSSASADQQEFNEILDDFSEAKIGIRSL